MSQRKKKASTDRDSKYIQLTLGLDDSLQQESNLSNEILAVNNTIETESLINSANQREIFQNNLLANVTVDEPGITDDIKTNLLKEDESKNLDAKNIGINPSEGICQLYIPVSYEEIVKTIDKKSAKIADLIVPVTEFEKKITQVVNDIKNSGYLLFLYGASGVGKSTFISSLEWRTHVPIKQITVLQYLVCQIYSRAKKRETK